MAHSGVLDPENHWSIPAVWRVAVEGESMVAWQLYADLDPVRRIVNRLKAT